MLFRSASFASTAPVLTSSLNGAILLVGATNSVTGTLNVNFPGTSGGTVAYSLSVPIASQVFTVAGTANQFGSDGNAFLNGSGTITSSGTGCATGCTSAVNNSSGPVQGSLAGTGATRAGLNYGFGAPGLNGIVSGTVVFK